MKLRIINVRLQTLPINFIDPGLKFFIEMMLGCVDFVEEAVI